ncbi:hypothetical protein GS399_17390 [Pedobacter sp. HMF7647]|uniref:Secreted repeat protein with Y-X4-D motif n=1 Tax=Hufsiella arboris TaxID=2695275 RepID=A0A7K1YEB3_9SPHI|nr:hypothetical protein [Hufsiella arboris]MXV52750.1 hypothetical protein [Hufsiella arboris]
MKTYLKNCLVLVIGLSGALLACKKNNSGNDDDNNPPIKRGVLLRSTNDFGNILTDSAGRSLYFFSPDVAGNSVCSGQCLVVWPKFYTNGAITADGLNSADFSTITRPDGSSQTAYKGWPLYYYQDDIYDGDIKGDKVNDVWFVAKPDYNIMVSRAQLVGADNQNYTGQLVKGTGATIYLTDAMGRTLYAFNPDKINKNNFTRSDFSNNAIWPIYESEPMKVPSTLDAASFGVIDVFGKKQLTFKGWPMYYFGLDSAKRGVNKGVSINNWQIALPALSAATP